MAGKRTSLASLMVGTTSEPEQPKWPTTVKFADMADNPDNPRETLRDLEGLAATIKERGILQDLVLVPRENWLKAHPEHDKPIEDGGIGEKSFVILIGHRRRYASEMAGLDEAPVKVREDVAVTSRRDALIENVQRDDLSPLEEAYAIRDLMQEEDISQREASATLGKTPAWVSQRLALLGLVPELQQALAEGRLKVEDARRIGKLPAEQQAMPAEPKPASAPSPTPALASGPRFSPQPPATVQRNGGEGDRRPLSTDDDGLDEALRLEAAAHQLANQRALRRVVERQPAKARSILETLESVISELKADLAVKG